MAKANYNLLSKWAQKAFHPQMQEKAPANDTAAFSTASASTPRPAMHGGPDQVGRQVMHYPQAYPAGNGVQPFQDVESQALLYGDWRTNPFVRLSTRTFNPGVSGEPGVKGIYAVKTGIVANAPFIFNPRRNAATARSTSLRLGADFSHQSGIDNNKAPKFNGVIP
jgi:hypothetical protein